MYPAQGANKVRYRCKGSLYSYWNMRDVLVYVIDPVKCRLDASLT